MAVHWLLGDAFEVGADNGGTAPTAADGDVFQLLADHAQLGVFDLANTMSFIWQANDTVTVGWPTGPNTLDDLGSGTSFIINETSDPTREFMVSISGFQNDPGATLRISDPWWWKGIAPTIQPDGNGGSLVVNTAGRAFVDLVGDPAPNLAQLRNFRAYA